MFNTHREIIACLAPILSPRLCHRYQSIGRCPKQVRDFVAVVAPFSLRKYHNAATRCFRMNIGKDYNDQKQCWK